MVRYSDQELEEFRNIIQAKLDQTSTELDRLKHELLESQPGTKSFEDSAEHTLKDELSIMATRQAKLKDELMAALMRIGNKTYGVCKVSGELIPKERLRAIPQATVGLR